MVRMDESLSQSQAVWASHDEPLPELSGRSVNNLTTEEHHILEGNTTPVLPSASASPSPPASIISREDKDVTDSYTSVWGSLTRLVGKSKPVPTTAEKAEDWTDLGESSGDSASIRTIRPKKKGSSGAEARNQELPHKQSSGWIRVKDSEQIAAQLEWTPAAMESGDDFEGDKWQQAGQNADAQDLAGPGMYGRLECSVGKPQKEGEGTQNAYISYLVTTDTDFKSFQSTHSSVRRRFTDFVFLYKTLSREYPQCAVPPLPDKHKMEYVRGDRFGPDFTARRAHSLARFLKRMTLHPVLRRAALFTMFLESTDWNATMKSRPTRGMSASEPSSGSVLETWTDSFLNAFSKPHKADKRFVEVRERAEKLDDDLGTVSKTVARVARRQSDLETDYSDLATQFQKLAQLEPGVQNELTGFATSIETMSQGWKGVREHTDQDYLGSLRDMEAYCLSLKALLKTREQKQLDFEGLTEYQTKAANERDSLASNANMGASGFIRAKIEDVRGVDHEASRRERVRKLEVQIRRLQDEVETAKKTSEAFDEEVIKEVSDFERIKAVEFSDTLGGLADANVAFFKGTIETWEKFLQDMERDGNPGGG